MRLLVGAIVIFCCQDRHQVEWAPGASHQDIGYIEYIGLLYRPLSPYLPRCHILATFLLTSNRTPRPKESVTAHCSHESASWHLEGIYVPGGGRNRRGSACYGQDQEGQYPEAADLGTESSLAVVHGV